jgi:hypothetical protein
MRRIALHKKILKRFSPDYCGPRANAIGSAGIIEQNISSASSDASIDPESRQRRKTRDQISTKMTWLINQLYIYLANRLSTSCLALCEKMQQRLPQELRDLVYKHIL